MIRSKNLTFEVFNPIQFIARIRVVIKSLRICLIQKLELHSQRFAVTMTFG